jgi:hypothetical protein
MKTCEIKYEPVVIDGTSIDKYNIYYYNNGELESIEFHSTDGINGEARPGYTKLN